jgi:hypothetical protein
MPELETAYKRIAEAEVKLLSDLVQEVVAIGQQEHAMRLELETWLAAMRAGWMPIETAPKDGTRVFIVEDGKVVRAWYVVVPYREERDSDGRYINHTDHEEFWMGDDGDVYDEPTHWQPEAPLPAPPLASEEKEL